jgi:hypothetical protein
VQRDVAHEIGVFALRQQIGGISDGVQQRDQPGFVLGGEIAQHVTEHAIFMAGMANA